MMSKHTPGPWSYWSGYNHVDKIEAQVTAEDGEIVIASYNNLIDEGEANAHLIAAAPDLLDALEGFIDLGIDEKSLGKWPELLDAIHKASAAIARAKGEEVSAKEISTPAHDCWFCDGTKEYQGQPCLICVEPQP